ncbi:MAG: hypothetical protein UV73_C0006G0024 [Candidatus Gottesmanbacteria bacterium GW2011_GWA2_43_14]|uniref:Uncharacterized protein n=1 Tax=Candidatus Gottesmanbacteria bacterium GW2011_GWA2_43_14 TaxID=1618443 RepID=A0A0G1DIL1_9BACT|nr:MAG: hypothetical protein UV73_C0006G0024 [Candidatus Gottesmanbacteria bacterium GW2011_GWA2_43_14]
MPGEVPGPSGEEEQKVIGQEAGDTLPTKRRRFLKVVLGGTGAAGLSVLGYYLTKYGMQFFSDPQDTDYLEGTPVTRKTFPSAVRTSVPNDENTPPPPSSTSTPAATLNKTVTPTTFDEAMATPAVEVRELSQEQKDFFFGQFLADYDVFKERHTRIIFDGERQVYFNDDGDISMESQVFGELFAHFAQDDEAFHQLTKLDRNYIDERGLAPWLIYAKGGEDETVVTGVMMSMAWVRLQRPEPEYQEEGRKILEGIKEFSIDKQYLIPKPFHWEGFDGTANPASPSPLFLEDFAKVDPYWAEVAANTRGLMDKIGNQIEEGSLASFPTLVDMAEGKPAYDADLGEPHIDYDIAYTTLNQLMGLLYCEDEAARKNAREQLILLDRFYYGKIARQEDNGDTTYDIEGLKDGYLLNGEIDESETRYSRTAWTMAAAAASLTSEDSEYRKFMLDEVLPNLPTSYSFNQYIHTFTNLVLSGRMKD